MSAYYNDNDPRVCGWLRELISEGLIASGDVDERPIQEVSASDVRGYTQCHFFAGIGGWSYALRLAGWPDTKPVWTGSCPCQPFSVAGRRRTTDDDRHVWPDFSRLIGECGPAAVFGEQVASNDGREWLARVSSDLEAMGYAFAGADLPAACVGSPHIRQRLFYVGYAIGQRLEAGPWGVAEQSEEWPDETSEAGDMGHTQRRGLHGEQWWRPTLKHQNAGEATACVADTDMQRCDQRERGDSSNEEGAGIAYGPIDDRCGGWDIYATVDFSTGDQRRIEPGSFPLVDGIPDRVGFLRGYGNAIVPQVAALFINAVIDAVNECDSLHNHDME